MVAKSPLTALEEPCEIASAWLHSLDIHGREFRSHRVERDRHVQRHARLHGQDQPPRCISDPLDLERSRPRQYVRNGKRAIALSQHPSCPIETNGGKGYGLPRRCITNGARNGDRVWWLLGRDLPRGTANDESHQCLSSVVWPPAARPTWCTPPASPRVAALHGPVGKQRKYHASLRL